MLNDAPLLSMDQSKEWAPTVAGSDKYDDSAATAASQLDSLTDDMHSFGEELRLQAEEAREELAMRADAIAWLACHPDGSATDTSSVGLRPTST
jgi:hypothetical protein